MTIWEITGYVATGLVSFVAGVYSKYLSDRLTDRRRQKEDFERTASTFKNLAAQMPELLLEIQKDLGEHKFVRDFVLLKKGWLYKAGPNNVKFCYYYDDHEMLYEKCRMLAAAGFISETDSDVTIKRFCLHEHFVILLGNCTITPTAA